VQKDNKPVFYKNNSGVWSRGNTTVGVKKLYEASFQINKKPNSDLGVKKIFTNSGSRRKYSTAPGRSEDKKWHSTPKLRYFRKRGAGKYGSKTSQKKVIVKQLIKNKIFVPSLKQSLEDQIEKIMHKKILLKIRGLKKQLHQKKFMKKLTHHRYFRGRFIKNPRLKIKLSREFRLGVLSSLMLKAKKNPNEFVKKKIFTSLVQKQKRVLVRYMVRVRRRVVRSVSYSRAKKRIVVKKKIKKNVIKLRLGI